MATPVGTCPSCSTAGVYMKSELVHHAGCTHTFDCPNCGEIFTTVITDPAAARREFFGSDASKTPEQVALTGLVGDRGADIS